MQSRAKDLVQSQCADGMLVPYLPEQFLQLPLILKVSKKYFGGQNHLKYPVAESQFIKHRNYIVKSARLSVHVLYLPEQELQLPLTLKIKKKYLGGQN